MDYANYIDITKTLDITDYYKTDTHWRQEKLPETAAVLAESMGALSPETIQNMHWIYRFMVYIMVSLLFHCRRKRYIIYPMMS